MGKVHIFMDGSWFEKNCGQNDVLAAYLKDPQYFSIDYQKLNEQILKHVAQFAPSCTEIGDCFNLISIFKIPKNAWNWAGETVKIKIAKQMTEVTITNENLNYIHNRVNELNGFLEATIQAGYQSDGAQIKNLNKWIFARYTRGLYREKGVDTTLVALLAKYLYSNPEDYCAIITGDEDFLPALHALSPQNNRVVLVTIHPDEDETCHRHTSSAFFDFPFSIKIMILQDYLLQILSGTPHLCKSCKKIFFSEGELSAREFPRCGECKKLLLEKRRANLGSQSV